MFLYLPIISIVCLLQAFKATQPEPFQKDRTPEDRTEYNGLTGMVQQQKRSKLPYVIRAIRQM